MINIVPFERAHVGLLDSIEKGGSLEMLRLVPGNEYDTDVLAYGGPAYTAMDGDVVLLCGGIIYRWEGLWDAWCIMSPMAAGKPSLHKLLRKEMEGLEEEFNIRRLQAFVRRDYMKGMEYLAFLDFKPEATLRSYGPKGEDMTLYVRFGNGS